MTLPLKAEVVTTDVIEMRRDSHWHVWMSPVNLYNMSWTIEGPVTWFCISQAQFTSPQASDDRVVFLLCYGHP